MPHARSMTARELHDKLEELIAEHGDRPLIMSCDNGYECFSLPVRSYTGARERIQLECGASDTPETAAPLLAWLKGAILDSKYSFYDHWPVSAFSENSDYQGGMALDIIATEAEYLTTEDGDETVASVFLIEANEET
jgi:hypothetical protein